MENAPPLVSKLDQLVQNAKTGVQLYRQMYGGVDSISSTDDFAQLPLLKKSTLLTEKLENTLTKSVELCITRTFTDSISATDYMPRLLSYEDAVDEYKILNGFMAAINNDGDVKHKLMLIADDLHIYTIAELGHQLAYREWPLASFIVRDRSIHELLSYLEWFRPTIIFWDARQKTPAELFPDSLKYLFTFNQPHDPETESAADQLFERFNILRDDWIGPLAIQTGGQPHYRFDPECFYFENSPDGSLAVTSFINRLQPVIRYRLPYSGLMTGTNEFVLSGSG
jgi:phenylacetate-coenzyme A ligase PaaK-like adenylate-forming protein